MKFAEYVKPGAIATKGYAERLLKDVSPEIFARFPSVEGVEIKINHPAFVFGHLSLYPVQLAEMVGVSTVGMEVHPSYAELFKMGVECVDDPEAIIYPPMRELTETFFSATEALIDSLERIDPESLDRPLENPSRRERFGTVGAFLTYILQAHPQSHLGQISGWRRCMGLGPA